MQSQERHARARRLPLMITLAVLLSAGWGCGPYSFSGTAFPHIKTIAVPLFDDQTAEFGVKEELTNTLIEAFNRENSLKIANRRSADSILKGTVIRVEDRAGAYDRTESVKEIQVHIVVSAQYEDVKKRKVIWDDQISRFGTYTPGASENGQRQDAISEALNQITEEILNRTVSGW